MEFYTIAKNMEDEGKKYYLKLAQETPFNELRGIFTHMANEEQKHFDLYKSLENSETVSHTDEDIAKQIAREAFAEIAPDSSNLKQIADFQSAYEKALELEKNSVKFYTDILNKTIKESDKKVVESIISEEQKHIEILESLIRFAQEPVQWLENAEWFSARS